MNTQITIDQPYEIGHRAIEGHFAGHPIIPGVVILADVMRAVRKQTVNEGMLSPRYRIRAAKFLRPVLPGQTMTIALKIAEWNSAENRLAVSFECAVAGVAVAKGSLDFMAENNPHVDSRMPPHATPHAPHWQTEQERSNAFAMKILVWVALHLGRNVAQFFLLPITFYFWATSPKVRAASAQYLRKVEASLDMPVGKLSTLKHIHTFSVIVLDRVFMLSGQTHRFNTYIHNFDQMKAVHDRGEGGLFVGAHLGSFEALRVLGTRNPANDQMLPKLIVRMAMYEENARKINRMLEAINPEATQYVISLGQANSMLQLQATIDKGEFVGMLADRHVGAQSDKQLNTISFLGEAAVFPDGPFRLAMVLKRPVFLMFGLYRGGNRYEIFFEELLMPECAGPRNRSAQLASWQKAYVERVEHYCRLAPYNWFNFYDFWGK